MPVSVAIADSQYLIRIGLRHLLGTKKDVKLIGEAVDRDDLFVLVKEKHPDVLIFDYNKPGAFSQDDVKEVLRLSPNTGILIISADNDRQSIYGVLEQGINSFLTKECDGDEIFNAIYATAKGEKFFCQKIMEFLLQKSFGNEPESCRSVPLTPRELEIARLVSQGLTAKEISEQLNISTHTIYTHRKNIMKKLKLSSTSELVLYAVRHGIVDSSVSE